MEENAQLKIQVDKCKDAIKILTSEYSKLSSIQNSSSQSSNLFVYIFSIFLKKFIFYSEGDPKLNKKLKKLKQMEEDNKRLRQLLKYTVNLAKYKL